MVVRAECVPSSQCLHTLSITDRAFQNTSQNERWNAGVCLQLQERCASSQEQDEVGVVSPTKIATGEHNEIIDNRAQAQVKLPHKT